jgi:hypothetical protein
LDKFIRRLDFATDNDGLTRYLLYDDLLRHLLADDDRLRSRLRRRGVFSGASVSFNFLIRSRAGDSPLELIGTLLLHRLAFGPLNTLDKLIRTLSLSS